MLKMIVATGCNFEIGIDNSLLWDLKEDMQYFKDQTINDSFVIMGRKTFESLDSPLGLKGRRNVVLTNQEILPENRLKRKGDTILLFSNWEKTVSDTSSCCKEVWLIGGASVYEQFIDLVDEIHWTFIEKSYPEANKFLTGKTIDKMLTEFENVKRVKDCYDVESDTHFVINVLKRIK